MGLFAVRIPRAVSVLLALVLLIGGAGLAVAYFGKLKATLRIATGSDRTPVARQFISDFVKEMRSAHPRIDLKAVEVADLAESAKALEDGRVDLAMIRTDVLPPANGQTLVILRRDVVAIVVPSGSPIDGVGKLSGKTIAIPSGPLQEQNSSALDLILNYFNVPTTSVKRLILPMDQIGAAIEGRRASAVLAVGPVGPGDVVDAVAAVARATRKTPSVLSLDDNDAISARFPGFESIDIPAGAFRGRPQTPDDDIKGIAVTYRFVVPVTMFDAVAGAVGRAILNSKARLMKVTPLASQIEAPDTTQTNAILPIHPGFANYLSNGDQSFFDEFQNYLYLVGIPLSLFGSLVALVAGWFGRRGIRERQQKLTRLLMIADAADSSSMESLADLDREYRSIVSACVNDLMDGSLGADQSAVTLAINHARQALERRRQGLSTERASADAAHQAGGHTTSPLPIG